MDTEVIRQFLVSIGVQVDEKGLKRFDNTIKGITKTTKEFAEALTAAAVAASVAVVKISEQFEDLYYASQRLHSSVENIKAFTFGMSQMGGNADAARQSLESFAAFLRSNPAGAGVVRGFFGVDASDKDAAAGLVGIGRSVRQMQAQGMAYWQIQQRAAMVGIDENTLQAMLRGTDLWSDQFHDIMRKNGVDMDAMAASATNLMQGFRKLTVEIEAHFLGILQKIKPEVLEAGVVIAAIGGTLGAVALVLGGVAAEILAVGVAFGVLADDFNAWKNGGGAFDWSGLSDALDRVADAFKDVAAAVSDLLKLQPQKWFSDAFGPATSALLDSVALLLQLIATALKTIFDLLQGNWSKAWDDMADGAVKSLDRIKSAIHDLHRLMNALAGHPDKEAPTGPSARARAAPAPANSNTPAAGDAVAYFMRQGWTKDQAMGIVAGISAEGGKAGVMAKNGAYGLGQWRGARARGLFARYGAHPTRAQELEYLNWEMTGGDKQGTAAMHGSPKTALGALSAYIHGVMRPDLPGSTAGSLGDMRRGMAYLQGQPLVGDGGNRTVTIQSKTDVTIHGASDAQAAAKATGAAIDQSNAALVRNTKSAVN